MSEPTDFGLTRISDFVAGALQHVLDAAARLGVELPDRAIVGTGIIPADCEQVVASLLTFGTGAPEGVGGRTGAGTYPGPESNMTIYQVTITLEIMRKTTEIMTGRTAPAPSTYVANLMAASRDAAVILAAVDAIADDQVSAIPRSVTAGSPQGGVFKTSARITAVV